MSRRSCLKCKHLRKLSDVKLSVEYIPMAYKDVSGFGVYLVDLSGKRVSLEDEYDIWVCTKPEDSEDEFRILSVNYPNEKWFEIVAENCENYEERK